MKLDLARFTGEYPSSKLYLAQIKNEMSSIPDEMLFGTLITHNFAVSKHDKFTVHH